MHYPEHIFYLLYCVNKHLSLVTKINKVLRFFFFLTVNATVSACKLFTALFCLQWSM